jgi:uncharacterized protein YecE (DUF72 family)
LHLGLDSSVTQLSLFSPEEAPVPVGPANVSPEIRAMASRLDSRIHLGTSSWAFPGWNGIVYDRAATTTVLSRHGLTAYSNHPLLRTVGIDRTYYGPLPASELRAYAEQVPGSFRFVVKAHELLTLARLRDPARISNEIYLDPSYALREVIGPVLEGLGRKAAVLLLQFPPQRIESLGGPARFADELHRFLRDLPREILCAVELRNAGLLTNAYADALADAGACHCYNAHPTMPALTEQSDSVSSTRFPALVIRWMLRRDRGYEDARDAFRPFDRIAEKDDDACETIARMCRESEVPVFVVVNNKAEGSAPLSVVRLAEAITSG